MSGTRSLHLVLPDPLLGNLADEPHVRPWPQAGPSTQACRRKAPPQRLSRAETLARFGRAPVATASVPKALGAMIPGQGGADGATRMGSRSCVDGDAFGQTGFRPRSGDRPRGSSLPGLPGPGVLSTATESCTGLAIENVTLGGGDEPLRSSFSPLLLLSFCGGVRGSAPQEASGGSWRGRCAAASGSCCRGC